MELELDANWLNHFNLAYYGSLLRVTFKYFLNMVTFIKSLCLPDSCAIGQKLRKVFKKMATPTRSNRDFIFRCKVTN